MKIKKTLSQEEQTILANIQALTQELMGAGAAETMKDKNSAPVTTEEPSDMSAPVIKTEDASASASDSSRETRAEKAKDEGQSPSASMPSQKAKKEITTTASDVATATDDAESRIEDVLSDVNLDNVDEVKKAIALLKAAKSRRAQKSQSEITTALVQLTQVCKSIIEKQNETETAFGNLLEGLGVTKQLEIAIGQEKVVKSGKPITTHDNSAVAKELMSIIASMKGETVEKTEDTQPGTNSSKVRKNLTSAVSSLATLIPTK